MDPTLAHANLAPPRQPVLLRGLLPALLAHAVLAAAFVGGLDWKRTPDPQRLVAVPGLEAPLASADHAPPTAAPPSPAAVPPNDPVAAVPEPASQRTAMGAPAAPVSPVAPVAGEAATSRAPAARPSFDCARARSPAERTICADPELSRLDRDLGRLHARAKAAAADPAQFKRENDAEWKLRESSCHDRECLRAWYEHRRGQLQARLDEGSAGR